MKKQLKLSALMSALVLAGLSIPALADDTTDVGNVNIIGNDEIGSGLIVEDTGTKTRSTVTRAAIEKTSASSNVYQLLNNLPSVNANTQDATGLFGGEFHVRGFNSDQIGFTINGAPVNDSGSFSVYPAEYTDKENICSVYITQGSVDTEAPHIGATGGNVGIVTCDPKDQAGGKILQSFGSQNYRKTFVRGDTGYLGPVKFYLSYSKKQADKWTGYGDAVHEHFDFGGQWDITPDTTFKTSILYNRQLTGHYNFFNKKSSFDSGDILKNSGPRPTSNDPAQWGFSKTPYWKNSLNPFKNYLWTANLTSRINDRLTLEADPYYWYGYGTGGLQPKVLSVTDSFDGSQLHGGIKNPGSQYTYDGKVATWRSSLTTTYRPGITLKAKYNLDRHKILAGVWYEHATQNQNGPASLINPDGSVKDIWLDTSKNTLQYWDGTQYEKRHRETQTDATKLFLKDTITLTEQWTLVPALRYVYTKRDIKTIPSADSDAYATTNEKYNRLLPSLGASFQANPAWQFYGNIAENAKVPANFTLAVTGTAGSFVNGVAQDVTYSPTPKQKQETSLNTELGVRYSGQFATGSLALYNVNYKNRQITSTDPVTNDNFGVNAGDTILQGIEFQAGTRPYHGVSLFSSVTYAHSKLQEDIADANDATKTLDGTKGNQVPLDPNWLVNFGTQYTNGPFYAGLLGKYTGSQYTNFTNTEKAHPYTVWNLALGYEFPSGSIFKKPTVRFNVDNLFDRDYAYPDTFKIDGSPTFYSGGPRFTSVSLSTEF